MRNLYWRYDASQPFDESEQRGLQRCVRSATDTFAARAGHHQRVMPELAMLENLASYVDRQRGIPEAQDRDQVMFRNLLWYIGRIHAGSKIVIWTATVHAARQQGKLPQLPLGARLAERWGRRLAVIGFTAFVGQSSMAGQPIKPLPEAPPDSLEARSTEKKSVAWIFLDSSALQRIGNVPSRLLGEFTSAEWSTYFDAVLVIRQESAPMFES